MSKRINLSSNNPWETIAGYSRLVRINNIIEVAGTTSVEKDKVRGQGNMYEQTSFILKKIKSALEEAGSGLSDVIRTRVYLTDINLWEEAARAHADIFKDIRPVTSFIEVPRLIRPDLLVEIEASAVVEDKG